MREGIVRHLKKGLSLLLVFGALAGGVIAVIQLVDYFRKEEVINYNEPHIPLVYPEVEEFRRFLDENIGKKVKFESEISFDSALAVNILAHEVCNYGSFIDAVIHNPEKIESSPIGIIKFKEGFDTQNLDFDYNYKEERYELGENITSNVSCYDSIRIDMKDPSRLRFSYGGTGTMSLPFSGVFVIEKRHFSGPSTEYTLREID